MGVSPAREERAIAALLERRGPGRTICPSEAARALGGDEDFRRHMDPVRAALGDLDTARGPIRLRRPL